MDYAIIALLSLLLIAVIILIIRSFSKGSDKGEIVRQIREDSRADSAQLRQEVTSGVQQSVKNLGDMIALNQQNASRSQSEKIAMLEDRFKTFSLENEQKLENIRATMEKRLTYMQEDNNKKLDEVRKTVDDKLQKTLEEKMNQSFSLVNERLEQVYKVLSGVKTRGFLG